MPRGCAWRGSHWAGIGCSRGVLVPFIGVGGTLERRPEIPPADVRADQRRKRTEFLHTLWITLGGLVLALLGLASEAAVLRRTRRSLPIRILVIGTRGKSSVVRLVHAMLRDAGCRAFGKTTGSEARILLPDGDEAPIKRRSAPSILEQKKILRQAKRASCDVLVVEGMAISPENARVESLQLIRPTHVLLTNARVDHVELTGSSRCEVASSLAWAIPPGIPVYVPHEELGDTGVRAALESARGRLIAVGGPQSGGPCPSRPAGEVDLAARRAHLQERLAAEAGQRQFFANVQLAEACCRALDLDHDLDSSADRSSRGEGWLPADLRADAGALQLVTDVANDVVILNAFSANEPLSTALIVSAIRNEYPELARRRTVGVFNIRRDRGDRTHLWLAALRAGQLPLSELALIGDRAHCRAAKRMLRRDVDIPIRVLRERRADRAAEQLIDGYRRQLLLCFGNYGGIGRELTDLWGRMCDRYGS